MKALDMLVILLTVLFVTLKLTGVIAWSWAWVFAPLMIWAAIGLICLLIIAMLAIFIAKLG